LGGDALEHRVRRHPTGVTLELQLQEGIPLRVRRCELRKRRLCGIVDPLLDQA